MTLLLAALIGTAQARSAYLQTIPNSGERGCNTCHTNGGGTPRNAFGLDYGANGRTWSGVYDLDSDDDGCTNGEELGDPDGTWSRGDTPGDYVSNPANGSSAGCFDDTGAPDTNPPDTGVQAKSGCSTAPGGSMMLCLLALVLVASKGNPTPPD